MTKPRSATSSESETERVFSARIKPELVKQLKMLAVEKDSRINRLLEEAVTDLLKKYKKL